MVNIKMINMKIISMKMISMKMSIMTMISTTIATVVSSTPCLYPDDNLSPSFPTRFCIVKSKPERHKKMQEAVTVLEQRLGKEMGEVSVFLSLKEKSWMVVVECYPLHLSHDKLCCRQGQGFTVVHKTVSG